MNRTPDFRASLLALVVSALMMLVGIAAGNGRALAIGSLSSGSAGALPQAGARADDGDEGPGQESDDLRLVAGLRARGLYDLADLHCRMQLERETTPPGLQADLVIEQILTGTARASSAEQESALLWDQAVAAGSGFLQTHPDHSRRLLIELQMTLVRAARADVIRRNIQFGVPDAGQPEQAIALYEECRLELEKLQRSIAAALPAALQRPRGGAGLSAESLQGLAAGVNYQIARCLTESAALHPRDDRLNRVDALGLVLERVEQVRRQTGITSDVNFACELLRVQALRLAGDVGAAQRALDAVEPAAASPYNRQLYWQQVLYQARAGAGKAAAEAALEAIRQNPVNLPETEIAALEWLASGASTANSDMALDRLREWADRVQANYGLAWGRLANRILLQAAGESMESSAGTSGSGDAAVDLALRAADQALAGKRTEEAVEALRRAATGMESTATSSELIRRLFQVRVRIADLLAGAADPAGAARELSATAVRFPDDLLAGPIHLRACWFARKAADSNPAERKLLMQLLDDQLSRWPAGDPADQARLWRAAAFASEQNWSAAIDDCLAVDPEQKSATLACQDLARYFQAAVTAGPADSAEALWQQHARRIEAFHDRAATSNNPELASAGMGLWVRVASIALRNGWLSPASLGEKLWPRRPDDRLDPATAAAAWSLLGIAEVRSGGDPERTAACLTGMEKAGPAPAIVLGFLDGTNVDQRKLQTARLLELQLEFVRRVPAEGWSEPELLSLQMHTATLHSALGQPELAIGILDGLAKRHVDRLDVQLATARARSAVPGQNEAALAAWRKLNPRLQPRSSPWFEARFETARLLLATGQKVEAKKMLEFLQAVPPGWKDSEWAERLDRLLEEIRQAVGEGNQ